MKRAIGLLLLLTISLLAAPVPPPKTRPVQDFTGKWIVYWSGAEWPTTLYPDGGYIAEREGGPRYTGKWEYKNELFIITERISNGTTSYTYSFKLPKGKFISLCGGLKLTKQK